MRYLSSIFLVALISSAAFAQTAGTGQSSSGREHFPSMDQMFGGIGKGSDFSLSDAIQDMMANTKADVVTENTEETVKSSIEGTLIVEEQVPEVNQEVVEAIDSKTKRYAPRLKIDYTRFPLQDISRNTRMDASGKATNHASLQISDRISSRLKTRLQSDDIRIEFQGRSALLTGSVLSHHHRELAETMLRLEPGIDQVVNELECAESPAADQGNDL